MSNRDDEKTQTYHKWEVDKVVDDKIKAALKEYDADLWEKIKIHFQLELAPVKQWIVANKFVATAVGLLLIGTAYQLFISLANNVGLK